MAEPDLETLRKQVRRKASRAMEDQDSFWRTLDLLVDAAVSDVSHARSRHIEERLRKLETPSYPTLLESALDFVLYFLPTGKLVSGLVGRLGQSRTLSTFHNRVLEADRKSPGGGLKSLEEFAKKEAKAIKFNYKPTTFRQDIVQHTRTLTKIATAHAVEQGKEYADKQVESWIEAAAKGAGQARH